jgi:hypothetical protein
VCPAVAGTAATSAASPARVARVLSTRSTLARKQLHPQGALPVGCM